MKNRISRLCAVLIAALLAVSSIFSVSAAGLDTIISGDLIQPREVAIREAVTKYFEFKKDILCAGITVIPEMNPLLLSDELKHKEKIDNHDVDWLDSTFAIKDIKFWGSEYADVELTETVIYTVNGGAKEEIIDHVVTLVGSGINWRVIADGYFESFSGFRSCSYVDSSETIEPMATGDGSRLCIVEVAKGEIGNAENSSGVTKYSEWYYGSKIAADWCVMFVSWCANQADVPTSVIPKYDGTGEMKRFFANNGAFTYRENASPQPGDIICFQGNTAEVGHVAIVSSVSSSKVTCVEGNNEDEAVGYKTLSKTSSIIVGYGRPAYKSTSHNPSSWKKNTTHHWKECENCGKVSNKAVHTAGAAWSFDSTYHWNLCTTCSAEVNKAPHTTIQNSATGKEECLTCGYESSININTVPEETSGTE